MKAKLIKKEYGYVLGVEDKLGTRLIAVSSQKQQEILDKLDVVCEYKLSLKNCQAIERGYDLDELAEEYRNKGDFSSLHYFKAGFQKALELNNTKLYTLEDMMNCWNKALTFQDHKETLGEYIQSLQQTEWDVEIEMSCVIGCENLILNGENSLCCGNKQPKLDEDGCLILKRL